jgi:hypothetical protein
MSNHRRQRITRAWTEDVISGMAGDTLTRDSVATLIASARPVPLRRETAGERRAIAALRAIRVDGSHVAVAQHAVQADQATKAGRRRVMTTTTVRLAVAAVVVSGGGVAVASGVGGFPSLLGGGSGSSAARPGPAPAPYGGASATTGSAADASASPVVSTDSARLIALCESYSRLQSDERDAALRTTAFAALVAAAGDRNHVPDYCAGLLRSPGGTTQSQTSLPAPPRASGPPPGHPAHPPHPSPPHPSKTPKPHAGR